jgi:hypothetical protein
MSNAKHSDSGPAQGARSARYTGPESGRGSKGRSLGQAQDERGAQTAPWARI